MDIYRHGSLVRSYDTSMRTQIYSAVHNVYLLTTSTYSTYNFDHERKTSAELGHAHASRAQTVQHCLSTCQIPQRKANNTTAKNTLLVLQHFLVAIRPSTVKQCVLYRQSDYGTGRSITHEFALSRSESPKTPRNATRVSPRHASQSEVAPVMQQAHAPLAVAAIKSIPISLHCLDAAKLNLRSGEARSAPCITSVIARRAAGL